MNDAPHRSSRERPRCVTPLGMARGILALAAFGVVVATEAAASAAGASTVSLTSLSPQDTRELLTCSDPTFAACDGKEAWSACTACDRQGSCACIEDSCQATDGGVTQGPALSCAPIATCADAERPAIDACAGKAEGSPCSYTGADGRPTDVGSCGTSSCREANPSGLYAETPLFTCIGAYPKQCGGPDAGYPCPEDAGADAGQASGGDDASSGCSTGAGSVGSAGLSTLPLIVALLATRRRRGRARAAVGATRG